MKRLLLLLVIAFVVFVVVFRQRLFLRDPLASVMRDGVKESGTQVFINYSNDVFLQNEGTPGYLLVVQREQHIGTPQQMKCLHWMACMTDADKATLIDPMKAQVAEMSGKLVEFHDDQGRDVKVTLR